MDPSLYGVWDEIDKRDSTLTAESSFVFTPVRLYTDKKTDSTCYSENQRFAAADGKVFCISLSPRDTLYKFDYLLSADADTLWMDFSVSRDYRQPTPWECRYILVRE